MAHSLETKQLVMVIGPSAVGKSTIMNRLVELDDRFGYVRAFTTRAPHARDQHYWYLTRDEATKLHDDKQTITYVEFPTTGDIYGTTGQSYSSEYNLLDTLDNSVEQYRNLSFAATYAVSMVAEPSDWQRWFCERYPSPSDEAEKRWAQAALSLEWSLQQTENHYWLQNTPDATDQVAENLRTLVIDHQTADDGLNLAKEMLAMARAGMWS